MSAIQIASGFSLTNRWLLYTSIMLSPAQFISGVGNNCPSNLGFLAYNWYTQLTWYQAIKHKQLDALCLLFPHLNTVLAITYLGGISAGNIFMGVLLGVGTAGVLVLNSVSAWTSWVTNMQDGFGIYWFYFFGWRTIDPTWHRFILVWQIWNAVAGVIAIVAIIWGAVWIASWSDDDEFFGFSVKDIAICRYPAIPVGAALMAIVFWPLVLWTELLVTRNHIESDTDRIAVWLFIAQVVTLVAPRCHIV